MRNECDIIGNQTHTNVSATVLGTVQAVTSCAGALFISEDVEEETDRASTTEDRISIIRIEGREGALKTCVRFFLSRL